MPEHPKIDSRTAAHIAQQVKELLRTCTPEWKETHTDPETKEVKTDRLGLALIACFARFAELIIERLNRAPEKNFLAFLDLLGAARLPPQPAGVPLTFFLAAGSTTDVIVPAGTQVAAAPAEGESEPVVFETERELVVASVGLASVYVRHPTEDQYSRAVLNDSALLKTASARDFRVYKGEQYIEHILYLGHRSLLGSQALQELTLDVKLETKLESADQRQVSWEIYNGREWTEIKPKANTTQGLTTSGVITLTLNAPSIETTVFSRRSRWLRCRLTTVAPTEKSLPKITELKLSGKIELPLDAAFADTSPLDLSKDFYPFGERPQFGNILYLAQGEVFSRAGASAELSIILNKPGDYLDENTLDPSALSPRAQPTLIWEYWNGRTWSNLTVADNTDKFTKLERNTLAFTIPPDIKGSAVNGIESYWVRARIAAGGYGRESGYAPFVCDPNITGTIDGSYDKGAGTLTGKIESKATGTSGTISATITGSTLSGLITGTIIGTINGTIVDTKVIVTIAASAVGRVTGTITGSAQGTIAASKISGTIKATLLAYRYASTLVPPSIKTVTVSYKDAESVSCEVVLTYNDFTYDEVATTSPFYPFRKSLDEKPALYLGFVRPESRKAFPQWPFTLHFSIAEVDYEPDTKTPDAPPRLAWEYWNGIKWASTSVHDETEGLAHSGLITWLPPADIAPRADFGLPKQYWLRVGLQEGDYQHYPKLRRVLFNTTMAAQAMTLLNEVLGSSDDNTGQRFRTNHAPVLPGQQLEVQEAEMPTAVEQAEIRRSEGEDAIRASETTTPHTAVWVRWHEVPDFYGSGPRDRHYVLDRLTGEIRFGDGNNGLIPPRGIANIRLARYRTGGGRAGNKPAGTVIQLQTTVPYIDNVTNHEPASGGAEAETEDALLKRAPRTLRHHERAVTVEDFEDLALLASPEVARALCVPLLNLEDNPLGHVDTEEKEKAGAGQIGVIIVPRSAGPKPLPDMQLIRRVRDYLVKHAIATANVSVAGPLYSSINVKMEVMLQSPEAASTVEQYLHQKLTAFLHPLTGGQQGAGWPFGERPQESDVYRLIAEVPGVDYVRALTVNMGAIEEANVGEDKVKEIMATHRFLIYSGQHKITLSFERR